MSSRRPRSPKYRHYKPKNLAVVRIAGRDHYLGKYGSQESYERYDRLVAEWLLARQHQHGFEAGEPGCPKNTQVSLNELILAFW